MWVPVLLFILFINTTSQAQVKIPYDNNPVVADSKIGVKEWDNVFKVQVNDTIYLYFKQDTHNIYWCLHAKSTPPALVAVDFYIETFEGLLNLHSSAKLGERLLKSNQYGNWDWWNNKDWWATVSRIDNYEQRKFLKDEVKEFILSKQRFNAKYFKIMFEIVFPENLIMKFPNESKITDSSKWFIIEL